MTSLTNNWISLGSCFLRCGNCLDPELDRGALIKYKSGALIKYKPGAKGYEVKLLSVQC